MSTCIEIRQLSHRLPSGGRLLTILDRIDLTVATGEFVAVLGPSGSGKSTLLALMAGLGRPTEGEIFLDGEPIHRLSEDQLMRLRRRKVGFMFQSFQLLMNQTARENILLPLELAGEPAPGQRPTSSSLRSISPIAATTTRSSCRAASSSASPWPGPSPPGRRSCSPTSPPATSTAPPASGSSS